MNTLHTPNKLKPWYISIGIIAVLEVIIGFVFTDEGGPEFGQQAILFTVPLLSLALLYLTLKSED